MDSLRSIIDQITKMYGSGGKSDVLYVGNYILNNLHDPFITVCYYEAEEVDNFFWRTIDTNVLNYPYLAVQIGIMILVINLFNFFLKPLGQPRFIAGILGGTVLGPSLLGGLNWVQTYILPLKTIEAAEAMGNISTVFYMFLVGLEIDMAALKLIRKVNFFRAVIGVLMPLALGVASYFLLVLERKNKNLMACAWWSLTLTLTSFPDIVQTLSEFKLLHKQIGRNALTASLVNHVGGWFLIFILVTTRLNHFMLFSSVSFYLLLWFVLRHAICWAIKNTCSDGGRYNDVQVYFVLSGMMLSGFIADACGSQAYLGAFLFGLIIPKGEFGAMVVEKIEDVIGVILLPIFFMIIGNRVILNSVNFQVKVPALIASVALASTCKFITAFTISIIDGETLPDSVTLGVLSNTKGVLALNLINVARNIGVFDNQIFTIIVISTAIMASTVKPIMIVAQMFKKPVNQFNYEDKTTKEIKSTFAEFRILACVPSTRYLAGIIKLLELSNPTMQSPLRIFSAHLIELTEGSTATTLILDDAFETYVPNVTRQKAESNQIANMLEKYILQAGENVSVQTLQVTSSYNTMHEDLCLLVKEHRINMILLPFHKYPNVHGVLLSENPCLRDVNKDILASASCSVALLIDRGLSSRTCFRFGDQTAYKFAMIFIGGLHDREALAYAYRMAGSRGVKLCVVRFLFSIETENDNISGSDTQESSTLTEEKLERLLDDEYTKEFISKTMHNRSITFMEATINSIEQIITTTGTLFDGFDLLIVGRGERTASPLTIGLSSEWHECEELGTLADILVASEFAKRISILVVRHSHVSAGRRLTSSSNQGELRKKKSRYSMFDRS